MSNVSEWSVTAGSNNSSPPNGWPEGMARSAVNDAAREMMAALAKWYQDSRGSLVLAGGTTAYTLATNNVHTALNDIPPMAVRVNVANTGAVTLAVDGLTAKSVVKSGGTALASGDLIANELLWIVYSANQDRFEILGPQIITAANLLASLLTVDGAGSGLDADLLDGLSSAAFLQAANNLSDVSTPATAFTNIKQQATTGATGVVELATTAEMQAGTDTARVPPVSAITPQVIFAAARFTGSPPTTISKSLNVSGVVRNATGDFTVTFTNAFPDANYILVFGTGASSGVQRNANIQSQTTTTFNVLFKASSDANNDPVFWSFMAVTM